MKKFICVFMSITLVILSISSASASIISTDDEASIATSIKVGDVNIDGNITIDDVTVIQKYLANLPNKIFYKSAADYNYDSKISIDDVTLLQMYISGQIIDYNNAYYSLLSNNCSLYKYFGKEKYLTLPSVVKNRTVTSITSYAFIDNTTLVQITLPKSYKRIEDNSFVNCSELMNIIILNNKLSYGNSFINCQKLKQITFK
ncbi:MAG: leucine-rich repeat protein [Ruminococcus sp.]|nr:leucine-rich repeat protein [Ruminococcus sp.]